ncbi:hypothetical protein [Flavivirga spongiicola]|uniref:Outer membrane lipoprotein-sorting protein n=1 Tax=Flavivirga spongiicola TaxID=421621 RepID=A0ABU7XM09_9FLAO|nr:hypothetical protein [Flavivirga sp. MEBiC05379]MDO5981449.1 hypothetical protein [Flavivirga sp. MEBiC05379]
MSRKMNYYLSLVLLFLGSLEIQAQQPTAAESLAKVETYYKTAKTFNLQVKYNMYKGHTGNHLTESYEGTMTKNGAVSQIKILGSEIIQFPNAQLTINKANKTLVYNEISGKGLKKSPLDVSTFLNYYKETSTKVSGNMLVHEMVLKNNQMPIPYNKIVIYINKANHQLVKQELYLSTKVPFVDDNGKDTEDVARMEISFKHNKKTMAKAPRLKDYVLLEPNKKVRPTQAYAAYTITAPTNL